MTKKQIASLAVEALKAEYPDSICSLEYTDPLQCLVATRLSAQCTDARVNMVTPALFERYTCAEDFAARAEELGNVCELYSVTDKKNTHSWYTAGMFLETREENRGLDKFFSWIEERQKTGSG